jgi:hypothetical protein
MRGQKLTGRFGLDYEAKSIYEGMSEDLVDVVGQEVDWYLWSTKYLSDNFTTVVDDIYDVSKYTVSNDIPDGRRWAAPFKLPVAMAQAIRGTNVMNERGFYTVDTLRLVVNVGDVQRLIPDLLDNPNDHIKDRIIFRGEVFVPTRVLPRGAFGFHYSVITIDCNQVNPEELVNDPQLSGYASLPIADPRTA